MNKHCIFSTLLLVVLFAQSLFAGESDALDYLYDNRMHLADLAKPINIRFGPKTVEFFGYNKQVLARYINEKKSKWDEDKDTILDAFIRLCRSGNEKDTVVSFPQDTILIHGIVKALDCGNQRLERNAFSILATSAPYQHLKRYGSEIIIRIGSSTIPSNDKKTLIALCNPQDNTRNEILSDSTIRLPLRARLGDKSAEDSLILSLKKVDGFEKTSRAIGDLFICGSKKCLSHAFYMFNSPIYSYGKKGCINSSVRVLIIEGLQRYYPYEPLLNDRYRYHKKQSYISKTYEPYYVPNTELKKYLEDFVAWGRKEFGITPKGEIGEPILFKGPCDSSYINK